MSSKFKQPKNPRKRLTENATNSRIAEADEVWHSTAIEDVDEDLFGELETETPIRGTKKSKVIYSAKKSNNKGKQELDSGRGRSASRDSGDDEAGPVVINPPSGHTFFSTVLQKCGYIIRQPVANNEMFKNVMKFRTSLAKWLVDNEDEMRRIETETSKFLRAVDAYLSEKQNFITSLKPTKHEMEVIQPSLLHCLLSVEALQAQVLKIVFLELGEVSLSTLEDNIGMTSTILNQLKWLPTIVEAQKFAESLLSILNASSTNCQSLIIKSLPEIIPSVVHLFVAEKLLEKFGDEGLSLNIALMDCFSSLDIPENFWFNIRATAIDQMANASLEDIPAYFSFLFRADTVETVTEVVSAMREKVNLVPKNRTGKSDAQQVEILEKVGFCVTVNPRIAKIWAKQVKENIMHNTPEEIQKIDLLMLFVFAESNKMSIPALKMLFTEKQRVLQLFDEMMTHNTAMVYHLFPVISKFLDSVLRGRDVKCLETVCEMSVKLFLGLSAIEAQTLMGNMTGILVNFPSSRETVLQILTKLAEENPRKLLHFSPILVGVLEYVMLFPAGQIRSLMNVLAILSQADGLATGHSNHFSAEFSILLRKQLTHSDVKIRCFGVFGAMASVRKMAEQTIPNDVQIRELLKLAWTFVERDVDACSIFLDELSSCVHALPLDICQEYRDKLKDKFEHLWTFNAIGSDYQISQFIKKRSLNLVSAFDANKECTEDRLVISFEDHALNMSSLVVPAHLRVLALLEGRVEDDNLVGIDAILGCPVLFPALQDYYELESMSDLKYNQRCHLGQYLVLAINFFRESVCAFVLESNIELRIKVWLRLDNILKLQKLLVKHFDSFPTLPHAYAAEKTIGSKNGAGPSGFQAFRQAKEGKAASKPGSSSKPKGPPKKSAKKKAKTEVTHSGSEEDEDVAAHPVLKKLKVSLDEEIQPKKIHCYLRRFDETVFKLLCYPLRSDEDNVNFSRILLDISSVSQSPDLIKQVETFTPDTLALVLVELRRQVQDPRSNLKILKIKKLLKYICTHMYQIQSILVKNEENDMADVTEYQSKLECCLRLLIHILTSYFEAIKALNREDREKYIDRTINTLAAQALRNPEDVEDRESMGTQTEMMANVASYLGGFVSVIKDSSTALDHLKLLKNLHDLLVEKSELKKAIDSSIRLYLTNDWKLPSAKVDGFLKIWLNTSICPINIIKHLADSLLVRNDEEVEEGVVFNSSIYKSCNATNFHNWYSAMFAGLSQHVYKTMRRRGDLDDSINDWKNAVEIFKSLVLIATKEFKQKSSKNFILTALLKHCRLFLEAFISGGAELLPLFWKQEKNEAQLFCKALQAPCRTIQHICEHSKIHTDLSLLKSVPLVRRVLESFVFRVREVLGSVGAPNAFWMGALKHRDLKGTCISSQIINHATADFSSDDDDGDDEEENEDEVQAAPLSGMTEAEENEDSMDIDSDE